MNRQRKVKCRCAIPLDPGNSRVPKGPQGSVVMETPDDQFSIELGEAHVTPSPIDRKFIRNCGKSSIYRLIILIISDPSNLDPRINLPRTQKTARFLTLHCWALGSRGFPINRASVALSVSPWFQPPSNLASPPLDVGCLYIP